MPTPEQIKDIFTEYVRAWQTRDRDALLACFTEDVVHVDPYPSDPHVGKDAIGRFFDQTVAGTEAMRFAVDRVIVGGDRAVCPFTVCSSVGGADIEVDAVDVITVDESGRISALTAYVDMTAMRVVS